MLFLDLKYSLPKTKLSLKIVRFHLYCSLLDFTEITTILSLPLHHKCYFYPFITNAILLNAFITMAVLLNGKVVHISLTMYMCVMCNTLYSINYFVLRWFLFSVGNWRVL